MKIGQKVIVFGDVISSFIFNGSSDMNIAVTKVNAGGMVLNIDGSVLGMAVFNDLQSFVSVDTILASLKPVVESL